LPLDVANDVASLVWGSRYRTNRNRHDKNSSRF